MDSIPRYSGIYKITCTATGKFYIGSSVNVRRRWQNHCSDLRKGTHHSPHLQRAWNKYGETAFSFVVIEYVAVSSLIEREQYWLDVLRPYDITVGFNLSKNAELPMVGREKSIKEREDISTRNIKLWNDPDYRARQKASRTGKKRTPEHRANIGKAHRGKTVSDEARVKLSNSHKGYKLKPESIQKRSESNRKHYIVTSPDGVEYLIKGLDLFCKANSLSGGHMSSIASGKRFQHKGWRCRYA